MDTDSTLTRLKEVCYTSKQRGNNLAAHQNNKPEVKKYVAKSLSKISEIANLVNT
jgi:hypothetical protein